MEFITQEEDKYMATIQHNDLNERNGIMPF